MLKLRKIAVTGGLSSGKSSVCRIFRELGAYVVSADEIAHKLLLSDEILVQEVLKLLGPSVFINNKLDRPSIARLVFQDNGLLKELEKLLHPLIYRELEKEYELQANLPTPPPLFVAEIPLLFEAGWEKRFDTAIVVIAKPEVCAKRFARKTTNDESEFFRRSNQQLPIDEKLKHADMVIVNDGSLADLHQAVVELYTNKLSRFNPFYKLESSF